MRTYMKKVFPLLLLFQFVLGLQYAQSQPRQLNKAGLDRLIDSLYSPVFDSTTPGIAITVLHNGKAIAKKNYGMASLELGVPFTHNSVVFFGYSETREFMTIAAVLMEEEGKLSLTDNVNKFFPGLPVWSAPLTIIDLINHSSGFIDEWAALALTQASMNNRVDRSQFLDLLYNQPEPEVEPGRGYMYSNSDYGLLRLVLEKASGENLPKYLERKLFKPLGMTSSRMATSKEMLVPNRAFSYVGGRGNYSLWLRDKSSPGGNYYIMSSANDLEKWAAAHNNPNSFVTKAVNRLKQISRPIPVLPGKNYPFGHKIKYAGNYTMTVHEGVNGERYLSRLPAPGISLICVTNYRSTDTLKLKAIVNHLLGYSEPAPVLKKFPVQPVPVKNGQLSNFSGHYRWLNTMTFQSAVERRKYTEVRVQGDTLYLVFNQDDLVPMTHVGNNIFKDPDYDAWLEFSQAHADSSVNMAVHVRTASPYTEYLKKEARPRPTLSKEDLKAFTGLYYSPNLDYYLNIILNANGKLVVKRGTVSDKILEPFSDDEFNMKYQLYEDDETDCWLKFHKENGKVRHFVVSHPRLMKLRFEKVN